MNYGKKRQQFVFEAESAERQHGDEDTVQYVYEGPNGEGIWEHEGRFYMESLGGPQGRKGEVVDVTEQVQEMLEKDMGGEFSFEDEPPPTQRAPEPQTTGGRRQTKGRRRRKR